MFKKGDKLVLVNATGLFPEDKLKVGDVVTAQQDFSHPDDLLTYTSKDGKIERRFFQRRFKKVEAEPAFKEGQKVRIIGNKARHLGHYIPVGSEATVLGDGFYDVDEYGINFHVKSGAYEYSQSVSVDDLEAMHEVDFTKPVFTLEGTPVQIITTKGRDAKFPVLAYEGKATTLSKFSLSGEHKQGPARRNLTNVQAKPEPIKLTRYVNLYANGTSGNYPHATRAEADACSGNDPSLGKRIGVAKVVLVEGQFDE